MIFGRPKCESCGRTAEDRDAWWVRRGDELPACEDDGNFDDENDGPPITLCLSCTAQRHRNRTPPCGHVNALTTAEALELLDAVERGEAPLPPIDEPWFPTTYTVHAGTWKGWSLSITMHIIHMEWRHLDVIRAPDGRELDLWGEGACNICTSDLRYYSPSKRVMRDRYHQRERAT